jgi:hypothetical protein
MHWWAWTVYQGRPVRKGPYGSEVEAYQHGFRELGADFEVLETKTRDPVRVKGIIRNIINERTGDLSVALRRFRSQPRRS